MWYSLCQSKNSTAETYAECLPCNQYSQASYTVPGEEACQTECTSDSHCDSGTYCATNLNSYNNGRCPTCHDCYEHNTYDGNACTACTSFLSTHASSQNFMSDDYRRDGQDFALSNSPSSCWYEAAAEEYSELYVGDCGAFGEETELWCDGYCIANSWLDCCDPKAGAIAALTMGCFFAFIGALFTAAWIFKCWCFKKPNALMLQVFIVDSDFLAKLKLPPCSSDDSMTVFPHTHRHPSKDVATMG